MNARGALALLLVVAAHLGVQGTARADATDECIAESELGQRLYLERRFVEARGHLVACGRARCPAVVTRDCAERLKQTEASVSTVVLSAKLSDGSDATDVKVFVDGAQTPTVLTGQALELDPGPHAFAFQRPSGARQVRQVSVIEGARLQSVAVTFPTPTSPVTEKARATEGWSSRKSVALVVGGAGVLGAAAGAVFGLMASASLSAERSECAASSSCAHYGQAVTDYDHASTFATASTIAFVAGGALIATAAVIWLTTPSSSEVAPAPRTSIRVVPALSPQTAGLSLTGGF